MIPFTVQSLDRNTVVQCGGFSIDPFSKGPGILAIILAYPSSFSILLIEDSFLTIWVLSFSDLFSQ